MVQILGDLVVQLPGPLHLASIGGVEKMCERGILWIGIKARTEEYH